MDELKLLIEMVANLPQLATWVLVGFLIYKVSVVGSIYGVIRLLIVKAHDLLVNRRPAIKDGELCCINDATLQLLAVQVERLRTGTNHYIHEGDVRKLKLALDKYLEKQDESQTKS